MFISMESCDSYAEKSKPLKSTHNASLFLLQYIFKYILNIYIYISVCANMHRNESRILLPRNTTSNVLMRFLPISFLCIFAHTDIYIYMQKLLSLFSSVDNGEASLGGIWCQGSKFGLLTVGVMEGSWAGGRCDQSSIPERRLGRQCEAPSAALGNVRGKTSLRGDVSVSFGNLEVLTKENWSSGQRTGLWLYHCKSSTYTPRENGTTGKHVKKRKR